MSQNEVELRARWHLGRFPSTVVALGCSVVLALLLQACNSSPQATHTDPYQLVTAKYADCQEQGAAMARYIDTGLPTIYDSFGWTEQRQTVLSLSGEARKLYIRQQADAVIEQCDTNEALQKAAEPPAEQAAQAALQAKEQTTCEGVGASWRWGVCYVSYLSPNDGETYYYSVSFDSTGTIVPGVGPQDATECATYGVNIKTEWHPDTDVCSL